MKENLPEEGIQRMARRTDDVKMHRAGTGSSAAEEGAEVAKLMLTSETPWTLPGRPGGGVVGSIAQRRAVSIFQSGSIAFQLWDFSRSLHLQLYVKYLAE